MSSPEHDVFKNKVRVRVCGIHTMNNSILLVKHKNIGPDGIYWLPPGGGVEFGESMQKNLMREIKEETGLIVEIGEMACVHEYLQPPLHAVEVFFHVFNVHGSLRKGIDPELSHTDQIIEEVRYVTFDELLVIPFEHKHPILHHLNSADDLQKLPYYLNKN